MNVKTCYCLFVYYFLYLTLHSYGWCGVLQLEISPVIWCSG